MRICPEFSARFREAQPKLPVSSFLRIEDEVAAIGAVQGTGDQQIEIGDKGAEAG